MRQILAKALANLDPDISYSYYLGEDPKTIKWNDPSKTIPEAEIDAEITRLQAEYDAQEYARNRASAYPSNGDQWDMIYKDMKNNTTTHADAVEAVKAKYPKPE
jgi:hypothetical protein